MLVGHNLADPLPVPQPGCSAPSSSAASSQAPAVSTATSSSTQSANGSVGQRVVRSPVSSEQDPALVTLASLNKQAGHKRRITQQDAPRRSARLLEVQAAKEKLKNKMPAQNPVGSKVTTTSAASSAPLAPPKREMQNPRLEVSIVSSTKGDSVPSGTVPPLDEASNPAEAVPAPPPEACEETPEACEQEDFGVTITLKLHKIRCDEHNAVDIADDLEGTWEGARLLGYHLWTLFQGAQPVN